MCTYLHTNYKGAIFVYAKTKTTYQMKTNKTWYKEELELNAQLYELGLISHVEKISKDIKVKAVYLSQKKDEQ